MFLITNVPIPVIVVVKNVAKWMNNPSPVGGVPPLSSIFCSDCVWFSVVILFSTGFSSSTTTGLLGSDVRFTGVSLTGLVGFSGWFGSGVGVGTTGVLSSTGCSGFGVGFGVGVGTSGVGSVGWLGSGFSSLPPFILPELSPGVSGVLLFPGVSGCGVGFTGVSGWVGVGSVGVTGCYGSGVGVGAVTFLYTWTVSPFASVRVVTYS